MIKKLDLPKLKKVLGEKPSAVITMHRGPDGDAVGSSLGWYHILKNAGVQPVVIAPDNYPSFLKWMPGDDEILIFEKDRSKAKSVLKKCDLIFCLDFNASSRLGDFEEAVVKAEKPIYVIDHHQEPQEFAEAYYVDPEACSTAEMIYRLTLALEWKDKLNKEAAICLYTGLVTDTGSFRFSSVTPDVMRMAADLMQKGIDHTRVYDEVYDKSSLNRLKLQGFALHEKLKIVDGAPVAYIALSSDELDRFNYQKGDTEGLVNYALGIEGVKLAGFFYERDGFIKVSLRSKGELDVNAIARKYFDGGGHVNAAGGKSSLKMNETLMKFEELSRELEIEL